MAKKTEPTDAAHAPNGAVGRRAGAGGTGGGNPSIPDYAWPGYDPQQVRTMVFDRQVGVRSAPLADALQLLKA